MPHKVTIEQVLSEIKDVEYLFPRGEVTTICVLTLQNGRQVAGVVFGQTYNVEIGKREARDKAIREIWPLLVDRAHTQNWRCWHCGYVAKNEVEARAHFGPNASHPPECQP